MTKDNLDSDWPPDCGAIKPEEECGECEACDQAEYQAIESDVEAGVISDAEGRARHIARGDHVIE